MPERPDPELRHWPVTGPRLPDGAGVLIGAGLGSVVWMGLLAWLW